MLITECPIEDRAKCQVLHSQRLQQLSFHTHNYSIYLEHAYLACNVCNKCIISLTNLIETSQL